MRKRYKILLLFLCNIASVFLFSQNHPQVFNFDKNDYEASSKNWSIASDNRGIIYVGNQEGLLQYDGHNWNLYRMPAGGVVRSVFVDDTRIYTGTYEEFGYWEPDETGILHYISLSSQLKNFTFHNQEIWKILKWKDCIYFQSFTDVFKYCGEEIYASDKTNYFILFLLNTGDRIIAQDVYRGIVELNDDLSFKVINNNKEIIDAEFKTALHLKDNKYVLGSATKGLFILEGNKIQPWNTEAHLILKDKQINTGISDGKYFYIGTILDGLYIIDKDGKVIDHFSTKNYLSNNTVLGIYFDRYKYLWLALNKGLSLITFNTPYKPVINENSKIGSVYSASLYNGYLYLGTNQGVYYQTFDESKISNIVLDDFKYVEGSLGQTYALKVIDQQLLCGHITGSYRIENTNQFKKICDIPGGQNFVKFTNNKNEYLIQSTFSAILRYTKDKYGNWNFSTRVRNFSEPAKHCEVDHRGNIWLNHDRKDGIYKIRLTEDFDSVSTMKYFDSENNLPPGVNANVGKLDGRIVFTTEKGIYTYDELDKQIISYYQINDQLGEFANSLRVINAGNKLYWFILKDKSGLFKIMNDNAQKIIQFNFNRPEIYMVENFENISSLTQDLHLICLENGFALYNTKQDNTKDTISHRIYFREILAGDDQNRVPLANDKEKEKLTLKYRNNYINFNYSALKYPGTGIKYNHRLEGLEDNWSSYSAKNRVSYSRLPWGEYVFRVKGMDELGKEISQASFQFEVLPPWYASNLAIALYVIILISVPVGYHFHLKRQKKLLKRRERLRAEQKITRLKNINLQNEIEHKSNELANMTMALIRKKEALLEIKETVEHQKKVLGDRLPNRNYEKLLKTIDKNISNEDDWNIFEEHFDRAHDNFFKRLKSDYPELTPSDLRLCAYLQMNLTSKEIAPLLNISVRGVESHRYRLRKKLHLASDDNLIEFILNF